MEADDDDEHGDIDEVQLRCVNWEPAPAQGGAVLFHVEVLVGWDSVVVKRTMAQFRELHRDLIRSSQWLAPSLAIAPLPENDFFVCETGAGTTTLLDERVEALDAFVRGVRDSLLQARAARRVYPHDHPSRADPRFVLRAQSAEVLLSWLDGGAVPGDSEGGRSDKLVSRLFAKQSSSSSPHGDSGTLSGGRARAGGREQVSPGSSYPEAGGGRHKQAPAPRGPKGSQPQSIEDDDDDTEEEETPKMRHSTATAASELSAQKHQQQQQQQQQKKKKNKKKKENHKMLTGAAAEKVDASSGGSTSSASALATSMRMSMGASMPHENQVAFAMLHHGVGAQYQSSTRHEAQRASPAPAPAPAPAAAAGGAQKKKRKTPAARQEAAKIQCHADDWWLRMQDDPTPTGRGCRRRGRST